MKNSRQLQVKLYISIALLLYVGLWYVSLKQAFPFAHYTFSWLR